MRSSDDAVRMLGGDGAAVLFADAVRPRLLAALSETPDSAAGLARRLDEKRQRLNYHLRQLEEAGLIELAEERRKGNCTERVMRPVASGFVIDPRALGDLSARPEHAGDRFSATYLVALAARAIRELAHLREEAGEGPKRLATASMDTRVELPSPEAFHAFVEDLGRAVGRVVARHHVPAEGSRPFRLLIGAHPAPATATGASDSAEPSTSEEADHD